MLALEFKSLVGHFDEVLTDLKTNEVPVCLLAGYSSCATAHEAVEDEIAWLSGFLKHLSNDLNWFLGEMQPRPGMVYRLDSPNVRGTSILRRYGFRHSSVQNEFVRETKLSSRFDPFEVPDNQVADSNMLDSRQVQGRIGLPVGEHEDSTVWLENSHQLLEEGVKDRS